MVGDRPLLNDYIDSLLEKENHRFTQETNEQLYQQFLSECNIEHAEQIRQEIIIALRETAKSLNDTGEDADRYGQVLGDFDASCGSAETIQDVYGLLSNVLKETRVMKESMERMKQEFAAKTDNMLELRKELEQVRRQASTDALTGLANRVTFFNTLTTVSEESDSMTEPYSVIMMDIDHFKRVNDTFGHLVGDKVIRFVAESLSKSVKGQDTAARYGGEEFAVLLPNTKLDNAVILCNKIREHIANTNLVRTGTRESLGKITVSAGVAQNRSGEDRMDLLARADRALYASKEGGRNRVTASTD